MCWVPPTRSLLLKGFLQPGGLGFRKLLLLGLETLPPKSKFWGGGNYTGSRYFCTGSCTSKTSEALHFQKKIFHFYGKKRAQAAATSSGVGFNHAEPFCQWFLAEIFPFTASSRGKKKKQTRKKLPSKPLNPPRRDQGWTTSQRCGGASLQPCHP